MRSHPTGMAAFAVGLLLGSFALSAQALELRCSGEGRGHLWTWSMDSAGNGTFQLASSSSGTYLCRMRLESLWDLRRGQSPLVECTPFRRTGSRLIYAL